MNTLTNMYYRRLFWAISEADIGDTDGLSEYEILDRMHEVAQDYTEYESGKNACWGLQLEERFEEKALQLVFIYFLLPYNALEAQAIITWVYNTLNEERDNYED